VFEASPATFAAMTITGLDFIVHLVDTTTFHKSKMVISCACTATACPAKLVLTESTSHVVAARILFNFGSTRGAKRHFVFVFFCPAF